jgi:phosphocarrier protein HPr
LHARPAALFVQTANQYECEIDVIKDDNTVNGKSIMGIMTLAAEAGSMVTVQARGTDSVEALDALQKLFENNFGESE